MIVAHVWALFTLSISVQRLIVLQTSNTIGLTPYAQSSNSSFALKHPAPAICELQVEGAISALKRLRDPKNLSSYKALMSPVQAKKTSSSKLCD